MNIIRTLQDTYGKVYGILVFMACVFFMLVGAAWFGKLLFSAKNFSFPAFILMTGFMGQLIYHKKLASLISGIITFFFSLLFFMEVNTNKADLKGFYGIGMAVAVVGVLSSVVLIFSFLRAFKHSENL